MFDFKCGFLKLYAVYPCKFVTNFVHNLKSCITFVI
jgi:hypothetical protein